MYLAKIDYYSHYFKVTRIAPSFRGTLRKCLDDLIQRQWVRLHGRNVRQSTRVFADASLDKSEIRFHINYLSRFKQICMTDRVNVDDNTLFQHEHHPLYTPPKVTGLKMPDNIEMRGYQMDNVKFCLEPGYSKVNQFRMGLGKTFTMLKLGEAMECRILIVILSRYIEKWIGDIKEVYGDEANLTVVSGGRELDNILQAGKDGEPLPDVIIVSTTTLQRYIKKWKTANHTELEYMVPPDKICETLGIGLRVIDEAHQHFHLNFVLDLYMHCPKALYLTATIQSNDEFLTKMYDLMWPKETRGEAVRNEPYDKVYPVFYSHLKPERIRCISDRGYSHVLYEQSIWRNTTMRRQYLDLIGDMVEDFFVPIFEPGKKMLIFCSMVDTCEDVATYLNKRFKDKHWKISKYTAGESKVVIDTNDITVSTLGKSGTALDIAGLVCCLMTVSIDEPKANLQAKGRNRDLSSKPGFEHITPRFIYLVSSDIPKQFHYHQNKVRLFRDETLQICDVNSGYCIGELWEEYIRRKHVNHHE
nr:MAG TPA: Cas system-associated protein [Caudoviricetes sp.]